MWRVWNKGILADVEKYGIGISDLAVGGPASQQAGAAMTKRKVPASTSQVSANGASEDWSVPSDEELAQLVAEMDDPSQWNQEDMLVGPGFYRSPEVANQFAQSVAAYRAERGLTQQQLGRLVSVMEGDVAFMESGRYTPDIEMLVRFGRHLGSRLTIEVTPSGASLTISEAPAPAAETAAG